MSTISKFEELEILQMARIQAKSFFLLRQNFKNDFALINQINSHLVL